jgi:hypothetical protein
LIPGLTGSNLITSRTAGYPVPGGGEYPFPGESGKISHSFPSPFVSSGHGGGIRIAEIPTGLTLHGLSAGTVISASTSIIALKTVG